jgi:hypothetical protein
MRSPTAGYRDSVADGQLVPERQSVAFPIRLIPINISLAEQCEGIRGDEIMIGITLSSEQRRHAPADARRWIEREVLTSMAQQADDEAGACLFE